MSFIQTVTLRKSFKIQEIFQTSKHYCPETIWSICDGEKSLKAGLWVVGSFHASAVRVFHCAVVGRHQQLLLAFSWGSFVILARMSPQPELSPRRKQTNVLIIIDMSVQLWESLLSNSALAQAPIPAWG